MYPTVFFINNIIGMGRGMPFKGNGEVFGIGCRGLGEDWGMGGEKREGMGLGLIKRGYVW